MAGRPFRLCLIASVVVAIPAITLSATSPSSVWDGAYSPAQAGRGQAQYRTHCASCHGDAMNGGDSAPALAGGNFLANWNGQSAGDLFSRIKTTMPLDAPASLSAPTVSDIEAFILSRNGFPAGQSDLAHDAALLGQVAIKQDKPAQ
jgi:S-disulfanyl-L-cysteine oxidoreductase SoxD